MSKSEQEKYYAQKNRDAQQLAANRRANEASRKADERKQAARKKQNEKSENRGSGGY